MDDWNKRWEEDPQYKHTKFFFPAVDVSKSKHTLKLSKAYLQIIVRAITGHNFLAKHQNTIGLPIATECRLCEEEPETFIHLCTACPVLRQAREDIFLNQPPGPEGVWTTKNLIKFILQTSAYNMLLEKGNYNEQLILELDQNYSSDPESE